MSDQPPTQDLSDDRRAFLERAALGIAGGLGAGLSLPLLTPLLSPLNQSAVRLEGTEVEAGRLGEFDATPKKVLVRCTRTDAWQRSAEQVVGAIYVLRDGEEHHAYSSICPHASCSVTYEASQQRFACPCHQSYFERDGALISGPGPRGLDELPLRIEGERVLVTYKRYRPGIAAKEEV
jgi:menaquinol-cytochrome c reductase iron-sulfur subunit